MPKAMLSTVLFYTHKCVQSCSALCFILLKMHLWISPYQHKNSFSILSCSHLAWKHHILYTQPPISILVISSCYHKHFSVPISQCAFANTSVECGPGTTGPKGMGFSNFHRCGQIALQRVGWVCILSKACAHSVVCPFLLVTWGGCWPITVPPWPRLPGEGLVPLWNPRALGLSCGNIWRKPRTF